MRYSYSHFLFMGVVALFGAILPPAVAGDLPLTGAIGSPPIPEGTWQRLNIAVPTAAKSPLIDGDLSDECWKSAYHAEGFYRFGGSSPVTEQTEAWITSDKDALYIAFHCIDSEPTKIRASETQRGGDIEEEDHVTVSIDSQCARRDMSSFLVSAIATQQDFREGGTADNISWAGDWKAKTRRTDDGWIAEISIPYRLLRYQKGAKTFGILLQRKLGREATSQVWPYVPSDAQMWEKRAQYMHDLTGIAPPFYAPKPTFLPFLLTSAGDNGTVKAGMDIKYPLTTTVTGVATLFPDFRTIEQAVADINFSYNEQFVEDRRPFFAEGADYLPNPNLFYSRRIEVVDQGIKVVGKNGGTTIGLLGTTNQQHDKQRQSLVLHLAQDIGLLNSVAVNVVADDRRGEPNNRVENLSGTYGIERGSLRLLLNADVTRSQSDGAKPGGMENINLRFSSKPGRLNGRVGYNSVSPDFVSRLGLISDVNRRGYNVNLWQFNNFDKGYIESYEFDGGTFYSNRFDGSFFSRDAFIYGGAQNRRGYGIDANYSAGQRQESADEERFRDHLYNIGFSWNRKSVFQRGRISYGAGAQGGEKYRTFSVGQGFILRRGLSLNGDYVRETFGSEITRRLIVTGTYRLDSNRAVSGRVIQTQGSSPNGYGPPQGTNFYIGYSQRMPRGEDIYFLIGDPNATSTRNQVTLKLLRPF